MHPLKTLRRLHPALFGNYDLNGVTVGSVGAQAPHLPLVTVGAGLVPPPQRQYRGMPVGTPSAIPGFTLRIGGGPDTTDDHLKAIIHMLRGNCTGAELPPADPYGGPQIPGTPIRGMRR